MAGESGPKPNRTGARHLVSPWENLFVHKETFEILLVEENADEAAFVICSLEEGKVAARLCVARDGAEALGILFGTDNSPDATPLHQPRLILLNPNAPHSLTALRHLRANMSTRSIPVVICGSVVRQSALHKAYALGANSCFPRSTKSKQAAQALCAVCQYWLKINSRPSSSMYVFSPQCADRSRC